MSPISPFLSSFPLPSFAFLSSHFSPIFSFLPSFPLYLPHLANFGYKACKNCSQKILLCCLLRLHQSPEAITVHNHQLWLVAKRRKLLPNPKQQEHLSCYPIKLWPCLNCHLLFICSLRHVSGIQPQTSIWITYHFVVADLKPLISTWLF